MSRLEVPTLRDITAEKNYGIKCKYFILLNVIMNTAIGNSLTYGYQSMDLLRKAF